MATAERTSFFTLGKRDVVFRATVVGPRGPLPEGTVLETRRGLFSHVVTSVGNAASQPEGRRIPGFSKKTALMKFAGGTISEMQKIVRIGIDEEKPIDAYRTTISENEGIIETTGGLSRSRDVTLFDKDGSRIGNTEVDLNYPAGVLSALSEAVGRVRRGKNGKLVFA